MTDNKQYPPLPDAEEVEQYVYRASRRYIPKDVIELMHDLMRAYVDADREMRAAQAAPAAWRHSRTYSVYEAAEQVPIADGDEWAEPLYLHPPEAPASQDAEDAAHYRWLRDYFAAQALAGGLEQGRREDMDCGWWHDAGVIANRAYAIADAMLKAQRKK